MCFFFFQAEDGIRDLTVTGVQTCALPILKSVAICNVVGSSASREADGVMYTRVGPEIGVASTKSFTGQLVALYLLAVHLGRTRGALSADSARALLDELMELPSLVRTVLARGGR